jgi:hypothetical protein
LTLIEENFLLMTFFTRSTTLAFGICMLVMLIFVGGLGGSSSIVTTSALISDGSSSFGVCFAAKVRALRRVKNALKSSEFGLDLL